MPRNTGITALSSVEAARNERRTLSAGALLGERRASIARLVLVAIFTLTVEVIPRVAGEHAPLRAFRIVALIGYAAIAVALYLHLRKLDKDHERNEHVPFLLTLIDFAFITSMALTDAHVDKKGFEPEMLAMAAATVVSFSIARVSLTHVVFSVVCAIACFAAVSVASSRASADALLFVLGAFTVIGVMVGLTNVAVRGMFRDLRQRDGLARFLPGPVVDRILAGGTAALAPVQREVTVLFSDIRGFTSLSEGMAPREVMALLDDYLGRMSAVVKGHDGVVGKFLGDGLLAFWGVPDEVGDHPERAVRAARDMRRVLVELNAERERTGQAPLRIGIGIHTGTVAAGMLGGAAQAEYTIIGDAVNVASRVEGLTKEHGIDVLISETTYQELPKQIGCERVSVAEIRGRRAPIVLYSLPDSSS